MRAGTLETLLGPLPKGVKTVLVDYTRAWARQLRFGAPGDEAVACENFGGHLVPFTTSGTSNGEVAIAHGLGRIPRLWFPVGPADTVNATIPPLTVARAADATFLYLSSPTQSAAVWIYCE